MHRVRGFVCFHDFSMRVCLFCNLNRLGIVSTPPCKEHRFMADPALVHSFPRDLRLSKLVDVLACNVKIEVSSKIKDLWRKMRSPIFLLWLELKWEPRLPKLRLLHFSSNVTEADACMYTTKANQTQHNLVCSLRDQMYRVFFFNWPPPDLAKCRPVSNQF